MTLTHNHLRQDSFDVELTLPQLLAVSNAVFEPGVGSKYASLAVWKERLSLPGAQIVYLAAARSEVAVFHETVPIAFVFLHPRTHQVSLSDGRCSSMHIWLAGVLPEWRKAGCLSRLMREVEGQPTDGPTLARPHDIITICTTPDKYPDMWRWLSGRGWQVERDLGEGKIMLSKPST